MLLPVPPISEQQKIVAKIKELEKKYDSIKELVQRIDIVKQQIISDLTVGRIKAY